MEMMHQVWAAGLHDAANCFQDALEAKWKLESQRKVKPKTNGDKVRAMTDEKLADIIDGLGCPPSPREKCCNNCKKCWLDWLKAPADEHGGDEK